MMESRKYLPACLFEGLTGEVKEKSTHFRGTDAKCPFMLLSSHISLYSEMSGNGKLFFAIAPEKPCNDSLTAGHADRKTQRNKEPIANVG